MVQQLDTLNPLIANRVGPETIAMVMIMMIAMSVVLMFTMGIMFCKFYRRPPADHAIVRSGHGGLKVSAGSGIWVVPILHQAGLLSLAPIRIELTDARLDTEPARSLALPNIYQIVVGAEPEMLYHAAPVLCSKSDNERSQLIIDIVLAEVDKFLESRPNGRTEEFREQAELALNTIGLAILACRRQS